MREESTAAAGGRGATARGSPDSGANADDLDGDDDMPDFLYTTWDPAGRLQLSDSIEIVNANLETMNDPMRIATFTVGSASFYVAKDATVTIGTPGVSGSAGVRYPSFNVIAKQWAQKSPMMVSCELYT
jgi:hypothetical protein